jgi:PEP-CTERM motif
LDWLLFLVENRESLMNIRKSVVTALATLAMAFGGASVRADATYTFTATAVGGFGAGPYGTVFLDDTGNGGATLVTVSLRSDMDFVNTGGPHAVFTFNIANASTSDVSNVLFNGATSALYSVVAPGANTPFGTFTMMIDCTSASCQNGAAGKISDPLTFTVANSTAADFAFANSSGSVFAADVICSASTVTGCNGSTGAIAAGIPGGPPPTEIPEPATLALAGLALLSVAAARRRKA